MSLKKLVSVFGIAVSMAAVLALPVAAQTATPKRGGAIVATWGGLEPQALFVPAGGGSSPAFTATKVFERLVKMERNLSFSPVLALSVTPSADFKTYTIKLRPNVKWHDGKDFTAEDVVFSAMDYWKPIAIGVAFKSLESAKMVDKNTVTLNFSAPMAEFALKARLADWALVLPKHIYGTGDIITNAANNNPVGTGPFKLKAWTRGSHVEFVRNEQYWDPKLPYLDRLIIRWWRDPASRSAALEAGELHIAAFNPVPAPDLARLAKTGNFVVEKGGYENSAWVSTIEFNTRNAITSKPAVRRALMHAINRQFIADTVYYKLAKPATSAMVSYNSQFYSPDVPKYEFDPVKAGKLLDEAGYPVKDGSRFTVNLVAAAWFEENAKLGQYIKQAFEDIKVKVNLIVADRPTALKRIYSDYDFDVALSNNAQAMELIPQVTRFYTTDGILKGAAFRNATGYSNPAVDKVVDQLAVESDPAKRKVLAAEFGKLVVTDAPILPLVEIDSVTVARKDVRNHSNAANYMNETWGDIWLDK
ncbi:ABC transporter substrate-binding protein [Shinella sp.]|uniref:ABC transporter substrate-binding protein n=1 Tax=Shinella sp. TaxID=1870904 RepID=UPI0039E45C26